MSDRSSGNWTPPANPSSVPVTPLNKGMVLDQPSTRLPQGSLLTAKNYIVNRAGPIRRPGTRRFLSGQVPYPPVRDIITYWKLSGDQVTIVLDSKFMYIASAGGLTPQYWSYRTGFAAVTSDSPIVVGSGTEWAADSSYLLAGDIMAFDVDGTEFSGEVKAIVTDTQIELISSALDAYTAGTGYEIRRAFKRYLDNFYDNTMFVDPDSGDKQVVFADGNRPIRTYDGSSFGLFGSNDFSVQCVGAFSDRLFAGFTVEGGESRRQRIRWNNLTDRDRFYVSGDARNDFVDKPEVKGYCRRLIPLGSLLVAYFNDSIFIGRPTGRVDLPVAFQRIESGGMGLVGTKAISSWVDGHYFVMQDDIYFMGNNAAVSPIGSQVVKDTIQATDNLSGVWVAPDPRRERICFGFPSETEEITKIWSYDYKAKAWSYDEITASMIANREYVDADLFGTSPLTWGSQTEIWNSGSVGKSYMFYAAEGYVNIYDPETTDDLGVSPIQAEIVTGDYDYSLPDVVKTWLRLSVKIDRVLASDLTFAIYGSTDRGANYESFGNLVIEAGDDENFVTFIKSGSTCRFKLVSTSDVSEYRILDIVLRVKGRGLEAHLGSED